MEETNVSTDYEHLTPFGKVYFPDYKLGLEYQTEWLDPLGNITQVQNTDFEIVPIEESDKISYLNTEVFLHNYPGTWAQNFGYSTIMGLLPQAINFFNQFLPIGQTIKDLIEILLVIMTNFDDFVHPFRIITENHM